MLETLGEDYVLTARAKGLSTWSIVWKHGLRNALLPIVTLVEPNFFFIPTGNETKSWAVMFSMKLPNRSISENVCAA